MILFGAGASRPLGVPTLQELTNDAIKLASESGYKNDMTFISNRLSNFGFTVDFESLLSTISGMINPAVGVKESGPYAAVLSGHQKIEDVPARQDLSKLIDDLKKLLVEKCRKLDMDKARSLFDELFSQLAMSSTNVLGPKDSTELFDGEVLPGSHLRTQDLYTLNYDVAIERYFLAIEQYDRLKTGFSYKQGGQFWNPSVYEVQGQTKLVKLHGSIDQFFWKAGQIEKKFSPKTENSYYDEGAEEEMMIYPVREKYVTRSPYSDLFNLFWRNAVYGKDRLCIIIGYSLRDDPINNVLLDAIKQKPNFKIIYFGKNAEQTIKNNLPQIAHRTVIIPQYFEDGVGDLRNKIVGQYPS